MGRYYIFSPKLSLENLSYILLWALPLIFTLYMWQISQGIPHFKEADETYSAFMHGWNLYAFSAWENAFLSDVAVNPDPAAHPFTYTHSPNLPRYISFLFIILGIKTAETQVLLAALIATGLTFWFISALFRGLQFNNLVIIATLTFFGTDFMGVLQWLGNLFRTWQFPLFFGCLLATRWKSRPWFAFIMFFLVYQFDLIFGTFALITYLIILLLWEWKELGTKICIAMSIGGAVTSIGVFILQLLAFYGWDDFLFDFNATYRARNLSIEWNEVSNFFTERNILMRSDGLPRDNSIQNFYNVAFSHLGIMYSPLIKYLVFFSLILSTVMVIGKHLLSERTAIFKHFVVNEKCAKYLWAPLLAFCILGVVNPYTAIVYVQRDIPLLVFPVIISLVLLCFNLVDLSQLLLAKMPTIVWFAKRRDTLCIFWLAVLIVPWITASVAAYQTFPPYMNEPAKYLAINYRGRSFVTPTTFPEMLSYYTQNWAIYGPHIFGPEINLGNIAENRWLLWNQNADRFTNPDYRYPEFYLCQVLPYLRGHIDCHDISQQMEQKGHTIEVTGDDFVIIRLTWWNPPEILEDNPQTIARFAPSGQKITVGSQITTVSGNTSLLEAGDLVLFNNHLLRVESDGQLTPLLGKEGQFVWIENLGPWNPVEQIRSGLPANFQDGQWVIDPALKPVNLNSDFSSGTNDDPIPEWFITPANTGHIIQRMKDETGPFIRVSATEDIPYLRIGQIPKARIDNPISVSLLAQVRTNSGKYQTLILSDKIVGLEENALYKTGVISTGQWSVLAIPWVGVEPVPSAYYAVGLSDVKVGDWFDVRELSVFVTGTP
jgi:hypothetical protein